MCIFGVVKQINYGLHDVVFVCECLGVCVCVCVCVCVLKKLYMEAMKKDPALFSWLVSVF